MNAAVWSLTNGLLPQATSIYLQCLNGLDSRWSETKRGHSFKAIVGVMLLLVINIKFITPTTAEKGLCKMYNPKWRIFNS